MSATKQEMLDAVNDAIQARLTGGAVHSYSIGGRNLQYITIKELMDLRANLQAGLAGEQGTRNYAGFKRPI